MRSVRAGSTAGSCRLTGTRTAHCSASTYPTATAPNWPKLPNDWGGRAGKIARPWPQVPARGSQPCWKLGEDAISRDPTEPAPWRGLIAAIEDVPSCRRRRIAMWCSAGQARANQAKSEASRSSRHPGSLQSSPARSCSDGARPRGWSARLAGTGPRGRPLMMSSWFRDRQVRAFLGSPRGPRYRLPPSQRISRKIHDRSTRPMVKPTPWPKDVARS
jgi:hypothetical protein